MWSYRRLRISLLLLKTNPWIDESWASSMPGRNAASLSTAARKFWTTRIRSVASSMGTTSRICDARSARRRRGTRRASAAVRGRSSPSSAPGSGLPTRNRASSSLTAPSVVAAELPDSTLARRFAASSSSSGAAAVAAATSASASDRKSVV